MQNNLAGKWALVTGASSGLGVDFAKQLAEMGCNLILVARRENLLRSLEKEIASQHASCKIVVLAQDLGTPEGPVSLYEQTTGQGLQVDVLVNNAGFGTWGPFMDSPWEKDRQLLELDIVALTHLTKLYVQGMLERNFGYVLQVASIGAYQPCPTYAIYCAAKSYVLHFSEALSYELRKTNVKICATSPGPTKTEFMQAAGQTKLSPFQKMLMMDSPTVVRISLQAMLRGKPSKVTGFMNAFNTWSMRFMPRRLAAMMAHKTMQVPH